MEKVQFGSESGEWLCDCVSGVMVGGEGGQMSAVLCGGRYQRVRDGVRTEQ
jgi:hypothetical protein